MVIDSDKSEPFIANQRSTIDALPNPGDLTAQSKTRGTFDLRRHMGRILHEVDQRSDAPPAIFFLPVGAAPVAQQTQ